MTDPTPEPVLWAVFTENGDLVVTCRTRLGAEAFAIARRQIGKALDRDNTAVVAPLYRGDRDE